jgi:hypothetical protein
LPSDPSYVLSGTCTRKPTLLIIAAAFSQLPILQWLLQQGANPNIADVPFIFREFFLVSSSFFASHLVSCNCNDVLFIWPHSKATSTLSAP